MIARRGLLGLVAAAPLLAAAEQAPALSDAQLILFESPHLAGLKPPIRLDYGFLREEAGHEPLRDAIRLEVKAGAEAGRFDVVPAFLTGPRTIRYPAAHGFRGNPLLLLALDRDSRELGAATGGSPTWFRNRIRRALAEAATLRRFAIPFEGHEVEATEIALTPFAGEPRARHYQARRYLFVLTEAVPGRIQAIRTELPAGEGSAAMREEITFEAAIPLPDDAR
jgi:hypothetical protein